MDDVFDRLAAELEETFRRLETQVPPPLKEAYKDGFILRYSEKTPQQAMLQKFARFISGLHSIRLLLECGFLQEMGVIQRTLDDFEEDILFFTLGIVNNDMTMRHTEYLNYHWMDERGGSIVKRPQVSRKHIRAYNAKYCGDDPSSMISAGHKIHKGYSGFVHGSGEAIIDMCMSDPPRYFLRGMLDSPLYSDHEQDLWNYMYRGLVASTCMARVFCDEPLWNERYCSLKNFETAYRSIIF